MGAVGPGTAGTGSESEATELAGPAVHVRNLLLVVIFNVYALMTKIDLHFFIYMHYKVIIHVAKFLKMKVLSKHSQS